MSLSLPSFDTLGDRLVVTSVSGGNAGEPR